MDFEEVQNLELGLLIQNVAPFVEGSAVSLDVGVQVGEGHRPTAAAGAGGGAELDLNAGVHGGVGIGGGLDEELHGGLDGGLDGGIEAELGPGGGPVEGGGLKPGPGSYTIKIAVNNVPEGPTFILETKEVPVSEDPNDQPEDGVITVYPAIDPDTGKPDENVRLVHTHSRAVCNVQLDHYPHHTWAKHNPKAGVEIPDTPPTAAVCR